MGLPLPTQLSIKEPEKSHCFVVIDRHIAAFDAIEQISRVFKLCVQLLKEAVWEPVREAGIWTVSDDNLLSVMRVFVAAFA